MLFSPTKMFMIRLRNAWPGMITLQATFKRPVMCCIYLHITFILVSTYQCVPGIVLVCQVADELQQEAQGKIVELHEITWVKDQCRLDIRKYSLSKRKLNEWNKLSIDCATSVNTFKNKVDTYPRRAGYT